MDTASILFDLNFFIERAHHTFKIGDHAFDLRDLPITMIDLKPFLPSELFTGNLVSVITFDCLPAGSGPYQSIRTLIEGLFR